LSLCILPEAMSKASWRQRIFTSTTIYEYGISTAIGAQHRNKYAVSCSYQMMV